MKFHTLLEETRKNQHQDTTLIKSLKLVELLHI